VTKTASWTEIDLSGKNPRLATAVKEYPPN